MSFRSPARKPALMLSSSDLALAAMAPLAIDFAYVDRKIK
jgi:hypothetical protein